MNDASRYELTDNRLSHLSPAQIAEITTLTQIALTKHWLEGVALENTARKFKDFPPSITSDELSLRSVTGKMWLKGSRTRPSL